MYPLVDEVHPLLYQQHAVSPFARVWFVIYVVVLAISASWALL